jgi:hypothetical protein
MSHQVLGGLVCILPPMEIVLCTDHEKIPARNLICAHAQDFAVSDD